MLTWAKNGREKFKRFFQTTRDSEQLVDTFSADLTQIGIRFEDWLKRRHEHAYVYPDLSAQDISHIKNNFPEQVETTEKAAEKILSHTFNLLGSGNFVPVDRERAARNGYKPIDWYLDPVRELRFPRGVPHGEWNLFEMRPENADIKYPWELARCQHWVTLAQAYQTTSNTSFAEEIANQFFDFVEANPVGIGVNWTCTMDVAIRGLNWTIAFNLIKESPELDFDFWQQGYSALYEHGTFIFENLENKYEVTSNHFLSNVVGLFYISFVFEGMKFADKWKNFCRQSLEQEINVQILPDGADYESSVPYHRLVTELFLGAARLAEFKKEPLSEEYLNKLTQMIEFFEGVIRPDGLMPQVGDADDGRLHIFTDYGTWNPQDPRHLFGPASFLLDNQRWRDLAGLEGLWETAWWGYPTETVSLSDANVPKDNFHLYPDAGLAVFREKGNFLLITNGIVGTKGFGNHKHNDQLGFEFHCNQVPLLVDPGSYVYTSDFDARNLFRGTGYHNTLMVDGEEQNELRPEWIFRLFETSHAEHIDFDVDQYRAIYTGKHKGYENLEPPVEHIRRFNYRRESGVLLILDTVTGGQGHELVWNFHFAPGVEVEQGEEGEFTLKSHGQRFFLTTDLVADTKIQSAWYSPSYGVREPCVKLQLSVKNLLDKSVVTFAFGRKEDAKNISFWRDENLREQ